MRKFLLVFGLCLGIAANAVAYTRILSVSSGVGAHWPAMPIHYFIDQQGSNQINNDSEFLAVHAAFQTWANVPTANVRFNYFGPAVISAGSADSVNLVSFSDTTYPWNSGTLAVTLSYFSSSTGNMSEGDILFNPNQSWSTSGEPGRYDIQSILTHEIGHFLGLDHSGMISSVMSPFGSPGQVDQRTLQYDDVVGISEIYPAGTPSVSRIIGTVQNGSVPVKGAHVVAVDSAGTAVVSTLSLADGSFTLRFLPPGNGIYRVYAEPLDGPVAEGNIGGFYAGLSTNFGTTYYPNASTLESAQTVGAISGSGFAPATTIQVLPRSPSALNITRPAFAPRISRGISGSLVVQGFDLTNGVTFSASSITDVLLGAPTFSVSGSSTAPTSASLPLTISPTAVLGPKNIAVNRGTDAAVGSGIIVVIAPRPSGISFSPGSSPQSGDVRVTVSGSNFRAGAQVFFGGIPSSDARFISSTTLDVLVPPNTPGSALVLVVNSDGTSGVSSSGFVYTVAPPSISDVSPLSGPPATSVTIDGANFDPFNAQVFFNGTASHVVSATSTRIVTNVPYGSTTGPVSVSSHGQSVTGPVFVVTAAAVSTNLAAKAYVFTDASASAGGTNLSFSSNDDGAALVALPFTFSLFRDIYPAGSQISVATNGFLSLESGTSPEFQNGPLPAQTSQKPAATTGCSLQLAETRTMPRSLIAPFFDDLVVIPGVSTISTRVVGAEPERRLIVQWSRLSVFDESGCDLHSSVTFQAVLFEGSNDLQFLYESLSGPRSDGISATVGLQDFARTTGIQTSFNQPRLRATTFVTYRFSDGQYSVFASDTTPPTAPVVLDGGVTTNSTSSLSASWSSDDPESGIREYQYAIGTSPGSSNIVAFTTTTSNFAVATGLTLAAGSTYYFSVRAVNNDGLVSAVGLSDGILVDTSLVVSSKVIPFVQHNASRYTGIAMLALSAMTVTLRAIDNDGAVIATTVVSLNPGQQYARLVTELFNVPSLVGWVEAVPSGPGLGIFSATGSRDDQDLDGAVSRDLLSDFIVLHAGSALWMVNPSTQVATVTITGIGASTSTTLNIPARGRISTSLQTTSRVVSTQPLAAIEVLESPGRLALVPPESPAGNTSLTFPQAVIGQGYATTVTLVNLGATANATVQFRGSTVTVPVAGNGVTVLELNSLFPIPPDILADAVRVSTASAILVGTVDIANPLNLVSMGTRPASTEFIFPHIAHGGALFTGLCFVTGAAGATITIDVYTAGGDVRKSGTLTLGPNQQLPRLVSELVPSISTQAGGYIRVRSDQPILSWEIYGSTEAFASGPPL